MKIYHGTTEAIARQALTDGLLPRDVAEVETRWPNCPSRGDMVYLTDAYAPYFAGCAAEVGDLLGIVEVETDFLDEFDLHPDEDFLEQVTRNPDAGEHLAPTDASMEERTKFYRERLLRFQTSWEDSVKVLGNCAHLGEVPVDAITRIALVDPRKAPHVLQIAMDPSITVMSYHVCGHKYRQLTSWVFGEEITPADLMIFEFPGMPISTEHVARTVEILKNRDGIEIIETVAA